jgi:peptide/nickel transport system substrate-binding protein
MKRHGARTLGLTSVQLLLASILVVALAAAPALALAQVKKGGTFRASMATDLTNLDLHKTPAQIDNGMLNGTVYETLFTYDGKFNIKPFLCSGYNFSPDYKVLTLDIKKGVKFHNGDEMTAEDVKFSLDRCRDAKLPSYFAAAFKPITEVKVTGPYQVQIIMEEPIPALLQYLATNVATVAMMPKKVLEKDNNVVVKAIGTGPYELVSWERDSKLVFKRFEGYSSADGPLDGLLGARGRYFDELIYYVMKEPSTRIMALDRGDLDFVSVLPYEQIDALKKRQDIRVVTGLPPDAVWYMFYVSFKHPILADVNFRKAMAYALDRTEVAKAAVYGYGTPSYSVISPKLPAYSPDLEKMAPSYDPNKAKEFLAKTQYKGEKIKILTSKNYTPMHDQCVAAQAMWAAVGINTELEVVDWATHLARWQKGEHEITSFAMIGRMDPMTQTLNLSEQNYYGYKNPKLFEIRNAMGKEMDPAKKDELFRQIYAITCEDVPYMINFYIHNSYAFKPYLKNFEDFDSFRGRIWNWYFDK